MRNVLTMTWKVTAALFMVLLGVAAIGLRFVKDVARFVVWVALAVLLAGGAYAGWRLYPQVKAIATNSQTVTTNLAAAAENLRAVSADLRGKHGVKQLLYNADVVTAQIGRTANTVRLASVEERKQAAEAGEKAIAAIGEFNKLVAATNGSLNGEKGVLPALSADLAAVAGAVDELRGEDGLLATGTRSVAGIGEAVEELRPELRRAAKSAADATEHLNGAVAHVETTTGYIEQSFAPKKVSFWGRVAGALVPTVLRSLWSAVFPERVQVVNQQ